MSYFKGQKASPCGHYHPDVLRVADKLEGKRHIRVVLCSLCGVYGIDLHSQQRVCLASPHPISRELMVEMESYRQEWHKQNDEGDIDAETL